MIFALNAIHLIIHIMLYLKKHFHSFHILVHLQQHYY